MLTDNNNSREVVIACDPSAVPANERDQWVKNGIEVYQAVEAAQPVANGFRFRLPTESAMLLKVAEYMSNERLCCGFLDFALTVEPNHGACWLQLSGDEGVKDYLRSTFESNNLLREEVIAGLYQEVNTKAEPLSTRAEVPLACNLNAIADDQRPQHYQTVREVFDVIQETNELPNGYAFRLPTDSAILRKAAEFIANERLCCPFFKFSLLVTPNCGPIWLQVAGSTEVKAFIKAEFSAVITLP